MPPPTTRDRYRRVAPQARSSSTTAPCGTGMELTTQNSRDGRLNRPSRLFCVVNSMPVPHGAVVDDDRACGATRRYLSLVVGGGILHYVARRMRPSVRAWHKASGAVVAPKLVHHENEAHHRPAVRRTPVIRVEVLRWYARVYRSCMHCAEVERCTDDAATRLQDWLIDVEAIEVWSAIDEVPHSRRRPPGADVSGIGCRYRRIVDDCQP